MRKATHLTAALLGLFAGFGGPEHGYFEVLQGNVKPDSLMISAIGSPCQPDLVWNRCEPAMTVIPSFWWAGLASILVGLLIMVWAAFFLQRRYGGLLLILLSVALLLVGGGLFPPLIGITSGILAVQIHKPVKTSTSAGIRVLARLWLWVVAAFFLWVFGQFAIGFFFNDWLQRMSFLVPLMVFTLLAASILCAYARDRFHANPEQDGSA